MEINREARKQQKKIYTRIMALAGYPELVSPVCNPVESNYAVAAIKATK